MGLAAARQLQRHGIPFVGFELHSDVGGLWDFANPHSTLYESAHLISSKGTTAFDEFPMADDVPPYPHHRQIGQYFRDYATHFGLRQYYQFDTRVVRLERESEEGNFAIALAFDLDTQEERRDLVRLVEQNGHAPQ